MGVLQSMCNRHSANDHQTGGCVLCELFAKEKEIERLKKENSNLKADNMAMQSIAKELAIERRALEEACGMINEIRKRTAFSQNLSAYIKVTPDSFRDNFRNKAKEK